MFFRSTLVKRAILLLIGAVIVTVVASAQDAGVRLDVRTDATLGDLLVDGAGNTLYLFTTDAQGPSACYDACAENWPPLVASGDVTVGEGVNAELLGSVERLDGSMQVTYGGWPLYTFVGDTEPGATAGQGVNDVWYVVGVDGTARGASAGGSDDELFAALMTEGAEVFSRICAACHGTQGDEELVTHVVKLAGNTRLENPRLVLRRVIHGSGYMPGFGGALTDREVAAVATYVCNSFGNEYGLVREEDATANR